MMTPSKSGLSSGNAVLMGIGLRCFGAIAWFLLLRRISIAALFFAAYAVFYAWQARQEGQKYATIALAVALLTLAGIIIGTVMRLQNGAY